MNQQNISSSLVAGAASSSHHHHQQRKGGGVKRRKRSFPSRWLGGAAVLFLFVLVVSRRLSNDGLIPLVATTTTTTTTTANGSGYDNNRGGVITGGASSCPLWLKKSAPTANDDASISSKLNLDCIDVISRIYPSRKDQSQWCLPPSFRPNIFLKRPQLINADTASSSDIVGIIFIKNTKSASSTGAGITLRIAEKVGQRVLLTKNNNNTTITSNTKAAAQKLAFSSCVRNWTHAFANYRGHAKRDLRQSILWTIVRQPAKRDVSAFYFFEHARNGVEATDANLLAYLKAQKSGQFRYLHTQYIADHNDQPEFQQWIQQHNHGANSNGLSRILQQLLEGYDFIAIAERMEESLAVLTLLWDLHPSDVIVLSAKTSGGYDDGKFQKQCHSIPKAPSVFSTTVQSYLEGNYLDTNLDEALYAAANRSLDKTIQFLGRQLVQERVRTIRELQSLAQKHCGTVAIFPCSSQGKLQRAASQKSCYIDDSGCGHDCVDQVLLAEAEAD